MKVKSLKQVTQVAAIVALATEQKDEISLESQVKNVKSSINANSGSSSSNKLYWHHIKPSYILPKHFVLNLDNKSVTIII